MNRIIYFFLALQFITPTVFAQKMGQIIGAVEDKNTLENLGGVTIAIEGSSIVTSTDNRGQFRLTVPVGTYTVTASSLGYKKTSLYTIEVNSGNDRIIKFELHPESESLEGAVVTFNRSASAIATDMVTPLSVQQLTSQEIEPILEGILMFQRWFNPCQE